MADTTFDAIQAQQISTLAERLNTALKILTGNENPRDGLVMDFARLQHTVEIMRLERERDAAELHKQISELRTLMQNESAARQAAELERKRDIKQLLFPIIQNVISGAIGAAVAFFFSGKFLST